MRAYRVLVPLLAAAAAVFVPAVASAEPYPAVPPPATVSAATTTEGEAVTFGGTGFIVGEEIEVSVEYSSTTTGMRSSGETSGGSVVLVSLPMDVVTTATADSNGSFSAAVKLTEPGTAVITATGVTSRLKLTATVTVADDGVPNKGLPTTGRSGRTTAIQVGAGAVTILLGAALVWLTIARRRRRDATTSV